MKMLISLTLLSFGAACASSQTSSLALCSGTEADRKAHAAALIQDGGPKSSATGAVVLSKLKRGCNE